MIVAIGNFLFRTRNFIFPFVLLLALLPGPRIIASDLVAALAGLALTLAGQLVRGGTIGLVYIVRGGKNRQVYAKGLVTEGVFAHCRNPMYVGNVLILSGLAVTSNSLTCLCVAVPLALFAYWAIVAAEEQYLRGRFAEAFDDYCRRVPRFIPKLEGIATTFRGMQFHWRRLVVKEYGTTFGWVMAWCALLAWNIWRHGTWTSSTALIHALELVAAVAIVAWAAARVLKKSGRLVAD